MEKKTFLTHVNALRGVAILLVLLYHLSDKICPNGYYGVDAFFVISGYFLFAPMIDKMKSGLFSWKAYYAGKFARIMPVLTTVVLLALLAAAVVMPSADFGTNNYTALWVEFGVSNILYGRNALDYFSPTLRESIFLHTWYISVLIQILIAAPVLCWFLARIERRSVRMSLLLILLLFSLTVSLQQILPACVSELIPGMLKVPEGAGTIYYMTAARLWEMLAGAFVPLLPALPLRRWRSVALLLGLGLILIPSFATNTAITVPILIVIGTMLVIRYGTDTAFDQAFQNKVLMGVGTISFSLYMMHWPVMALWRYVAVHDFHSWEYTAVLLLTFALSYVLFHLVEKRRRSFLKALILWGILVVISLSVHFAHGLRGMLHPEADSFPVYDHTEYKSWRLAPETALTKDFPSVAFPTLKSEFDRTQQGGGQSVQDGNRKGFLTVGERTASPQFILLGDSYAHALFPGFDLIGRDRHWSGVYIPLYVLPFIGGANAEKPGLGDARLETLFDWLSRHPEVSHVVICQRWHIRFQDSKDRTSREPFAASQASLRQFCLRVKQAGKHLVLMMPLPEPGIDSGLRIDSVLSRRSIFSSDPYSSLDLTSDGQDYNARNAEIRHALRQLEAEGLCTLLDPVPILMPDGIYKPITDDRRFVTYDGAGHLTVFGATKLVAGLADTIDAIFRRKETPLPSTTQPRTSSGDAATASSLPQR